METMITTVLLATCIFFLLLIRIGKKHNKTDWGHGGLNILDGINLWMCRTYHRLPERFIELPKLGSVILVSNHISGLDPLLLIAATNRPLRFMIAQKEYDRWWLKWLLKQVGCIPVEPDKNQKQALNKSIEALKKGEVLVVFPQGGIVVKDNSKALKRGAFVLARMTNVPMHSVRIEGVRAEGFTILAIFIRSKIQLIQNKNIIRITEENIKQTMSDLNQFFLRDSARIIRRNSWRNC